MATKLFNQKDLDAALKEQAGYEEQLGSSPTAFGSTSPSSSDLSTDVKLSTVKKRISQLQSQKQKEAWYGPTTANSPETQGKENTGFLAKTIDTLSAPLRGVVGGIESILGKAGGKNILEAADENITTGHKVSGDVLQELGAPKWVSAPLGFVLDVALDPVNWLTMGTAALVPRVGYGAAKGFAEEGVMGALKGIELGATSSLGGDVAAITKYIPGVKNTDMYKNLAEKAFTKGEAYNALTGIDPIAEAGKSWIPGLSSKEGGFTLGKGLEETIKKIPGGETLVEKMKYSPADYAAKAKVLDRTLKILEDTGDMSNVPIDLANIEKMMNNQINKDLVGKTYSSHYDQLEDVLRNSIDDTEYVLKNGTRDSFMMADNATDLEARMAEEAIKDNEVKSAIEYFNKLNRSKTGIEVYDNASQWTKEKIASLKVGNVDLGKKILTTTDILSNSFKLGKVVLNPASYVNNSMSNVFFAAMHGLDPVDTFIEGEANFKNVWKFLSGNDGANGANFVLKNFIDETSDFSKFVSTTPNQFTNTYGWSPSMIAGKGFVDHLIKEGKSLGVLVTAADKDQLLKRMTEMPNEIRTFLEEVSAGAAKAGEQPMTEILSKSLKGSDVFRKNTSLEETYSNLLKGTLDSRSQTYSMMGNLMDTGDIKKYYDVKEIIAQKAKEGDLGYKILDSVLNKAVGGMQNTYERIDQAYKMTSALKMTQKGLTEAELKVVARNTVGGISEGDVLWSGLLNGQKRYRLTWDKATDIANEIHMNYAAMPAFVRMMRSMPIIGSPFVSFTYGMMPKIGKTLVNNPASFNKVNFLLNEIAGAKTPLEKENLKSKYYSWFNSPGMVKMPFNLDHPVYVNLSNFIPYYSMNIFTPSERKYEDTIPGDLMATIDKVGLFKTPVGQTLWDYGIQPFLTPQGEVPQNQFGQPLYPVNSNAVQKAGYAVRNLAEAYTPSIVAPAGLVTGLVAPGLNQYLPSYGGRKFAEGWQGKNQLGILKPSLTPTEIEAMNAASFLGVSINPMDLTNLTNTVKKTIKK